MMKRKPFLFFTILITILIILIIITAQSATKRSSTTNVTPTAIPPEILTRVSSVETPTKEPQSQPSVSPRFDLQKIYPVFPEAPSSEQVLAQRLEGSLLGSGILRHIEPPTILNGDEVGAYELNGLAWEESTYDSFITIWTGLMNASPAQGILWVQITPHYRPYQDRLVIQVQFK